MITCEGCAEVYFPGENAAALRRELTGSGRAGDDITADYICNPDTLRLEKHRDALDGADTLLVFSCGVGVQTVAAEFEGKRVVAACDTYTLPGFQGVTPPEYDCGSCGQCYLSGTGGICPVTACSKSLVNGQCGGSKNGKCEVDSEMDCGWERIYRRLEKFGQLDSLQGPARIHDYAAESETVPQTKIADEGAIPLGNPVTNRSDRE